MEELGSKISFLQKNLIRQSKQLIEDSLKEKYTLDKEELLKISLPSFLKPSKKKEIKDIILITLYLVQMKNFIKLFGDNLSTGKDSIFYEQLKRIAETIIYQKYNKNRLVIRYGEEGTKFFLLLKGEVQILLPNKNNAYISLKEFKRYLLLLFIYKEFEVLKFVIKENRGNQRTGNFNASIIFFPEENIMYYTNNNKNTDNNRISTVNKVNKMSQSNNINNSNIKNKKTSNSDEISKDKIKEFQKKCLELLMKFYLTEEEISFYENTKDNNIKEVDDNINLSIDDYINRIKNYSNFNFYKDEDEHDQDQENEGKKKIFKDFRRELLKQNIKDYIDITNDDEKSNFIIYEYKKITELHTGDMFGDLALSANNIKRTATIITVDECHFACLTRSLYSQFVEKGNERIRNNKINYLCNINILKSFPRFILERKLFNNFAFQTFKKGKYVLKTNEINNNIIFLKDGTFEVSFTGKLNDLNELINFLYNRYIQITKKKDNEENEDDLTDNIKIMNSQKIKIDRLFQKDINEQFSYVLFLVNAPSIFGFKPTERKNLKIVEKKEENNGDKINYYYSNFCVKCYSSKGEYIYIDKNIFYKQIYGTDGCVQHETKIYICDFLRRTIKRLLNIRYIKIWNLFLTNGVDKNLNVNLNWERIENNDDIYNAVNKLLNLLNEGQLYSNEMSKYINDYFEKKRQMSQNQKQIKILNNQYYQSEKIKKMMSLTSKNINKDRNIDNYKNNKIYLSSNKSVNNINLNYRKMNSISNISIKNGDNVEEKYKKIVKNIFNISQENLNKKEYDFIYKIKNRNRNKNRNINRNRNTNRIISISGLFKNRSLFVSKTGKNININNYLLELNKEKSFPKENLSIIKTAHSTKKGKMINFKKKIIFRKSNDILPKENKKVEEDRLLKSNLKYYRNFHFFSKRPTGTKSPDIDTNKSSREKYTKNRVKYIIKNTRILFTKTKNLDKIVRMKRSTSTL